MNTVTADQYQRALRPYIEAGEQRAAELGNRGPIEFDQNGGLTPEILDAYWRTGFYVFENLIDQEEIGHLRSAMRSLLDRAPD